MGISKVYMDFGAVDNKDGTFTVGAVYYKSDLEKTPFAEVSKVLSTDEYEGYNLYSFTVVGLLLGFNYLKTEIIPNGLTDKSFELYLRNEQDYVINWYVKKANGEILNNEINDSLMNSCFELLVQLLENVTNDPYIKKIEGKYNRFKNLVNRKLKTTRNNTPNIDLSHLRKRLEPKNEMQKVIGLDERRERRNFTI